MKSLSTLGSVEIVDDIMYSLTQGKVRVSDQSSAISHKPKATNDGFGILFYKTLTTYHFSLLPSLSLTASGFEFPHYVTIFPFTVNDVAGLKISLLH
ncbi:hypothetical protein [Agriterribacter sp.]|uniref:hypothetical protein n=1 Tax=Agriterribacter sp. TaxID=2821509 RepID=UPI002B8BBEFF|nr:hypothetical protein [Agriterribacter sp.]HTN06804.1 hypothetical protein [Agriterribacter sp.]